MEHAHLLLFAAIAVGFALTWGVGANDLANVMSTALGSRAITIKQALVIAIIFEFLGALFGGSEVTATLRSGIVDPYALAHSPEELILGMLAVLLAGSSWMLAASFLGLPVSITHTIVGALVGFGSVIVGGNAVHWDQVGIIALSWIAAPLFAAGVGFLIYKNVQYCILSRDNPLVRAQGAVPFYLLFVGLILSVTTVLNGLKHIGIRPGVFYDLLIVMGFSVGLMCLGLFWIKRMVIPSHFDRHAEFLHVEKIFSVVMLFTACAMVFAHGSNDIAIAMSPIAVVESVVASGSTAQSGHLPHWVLWLGCGGVILGFGTYGKRVIETVGSNITALTPSSAFAATLAAATTVVVATSTGTPVSATQTLVGAVLGVGLGRGIGALNLKVIRNIFASWMLTLPAGAGFAILYFKGLSAVIF